MSPLGVSLVCISSSDRTALEERFTADRIPKIVCFSVLAVHYSVLEQFWGEGRGTKTIDISLSYRVS
jgi:hypothetical protein